MVCKCPNPEFITGEHCEKIKCANQGVLRVFPANSTWQCDCSETKFFGSTFCEKLIVSSLWSIVAGCILLLICVVCLCSANWFNRDRGRRRRHPTNRCMSTGDGTSGHSAGMRDTGRRAWPAQAQRGTRVNPRGGPSSSTHRSSSSDELISSERGAHRRTAAFPSGNITQQYVVRLDTIPTFNPAMIGGVEPTGAPLQQDMGPPPSYDQAMSSIHAEPPVYTPTDAAKQNA
ncbi:EGF-like domain-containing protein [Caenorhabditis elegans]|nr:EGF-like domain-containing protein [Caenorhabditis elegans]CDO50122.1 EGF-like domain-containing protein [Caenorhabditis elegans]|eukprot:NP_001293394.1 Uncharacterized protein CELE_Y51F10.3 [Caenorhabditis elegans]